MHVTHKQSILDDGPMRHKKDVTEKLSTDSQPQDHIHVKIFWSYNYINNLTLLL